VNGKGGRLYLVASRYELMPDLKIMRTERAMPASPMAAWDAYGNSLPYLYRALLVGLHLEGKVDPATWIDVGAIDSPRLHKAHRETLKVLTRLRS
jgi:hypothetical protein